MTNLASRISLQESRFILIQNAADSILENFPVTPLSRQLITTRLEVLESNWLKFQNEHKSICHEHSEFIEDQPYFKNRTYERCQ